MWEKGQADPAVHDPTLKNLQGTCERSLPEGFFRALAGVKARSVSGWDNTFGRCCFGFVASFFPGFFVIVATVGVDGMLFCLRWAGHGSDNRTKGIGRGEDGNEGGGKKI